MFPEQGILRQGTTILSRSTEKQTTLHTLLNNQTTQGTFADAEKKMASRI